MRPASAISASIALALACTSLSALAQAQSSSEAQTDKPADDKAQSKTPRKPKPNPEATLERVSVSGQATPEAQRRASTASKIIVGREEIEQMGDLTLGEVLKRLPGVTTGGRPGRGGEIRMRGMGSGYTQILVNGERMPAGFSIDDIPPELVERIEVLRAPTAEYGTRAIAGTINIVLREALRKLDNDLRLGVNSERGVASPSATWTHNDKLDEHGGAYTFTINLTENERYDDVHSIVTTQNLVNGVPGAPISEVVDLGSNHNHRRMANLNARFQLKPDADDSLVLQPFFILQDSHQDNAFTQTGLSNFDAAQTTTDSSFNMLRLNTQWQHRFSPETRLELRLNGGRGTSDSNAFRTEMQGGAVSRTQQDLIDNTNTSWNLAGKLSHQLESSHSLVAGMESQFQGNDQTHTTLQDGSIDYALNNFGGSYSASTQTNALYVQDEWSVGPHWSYYAGLRWEGERTRSDLASNRVSNFYDVWSPLFHAVWKPEENSRDLIRMSLTNSYRSPQLGDLVARPSINTQFPCPNNGLCGANLIEYPDQMGNPNLKPETALGVEWAFEHYLRLGGLYSVNLFYRHITDLIRYETSLQSVPWASVPRFVSSPTNISSAETGGIELEAKLNLREIWPDAASVMINSNISLFRSSVGGIQGPNNRIDQQPRGTGNVGAEYKLPHLPLTLNANLNYTPANTVQQTTQQLYYLTKKVVTDFSALWQFNTRTKLRLSASNFDPLNYNSDTQILTDTQLINSWNLGRSFTLWQARLEIKI